jgi:hypothetical protein
MSIAIDCKRASNDGGGQPSENSAARAIPAKAFAVRANAARSRGHGAAMAMGGALLTFVGACNQNQSGDLKASRMGDLSHALTERIDGELSIDVACATPREVPVEATTPSTPPPESPFRRRPYLQQMTDHSVRVNWVSGLEPAASVHVMTPDGTAVAVVPAVSDEGLPESETTRAWSAALTALAPDTIYCYEVRAGDAVWRRAGFRTAPARGQGRTVRFVALGDSGNGSSDQQAAYAQMRTVPFDFFIHTGDVGYGSGTTNELQRFFFDVYADTLEDFASFPASGNHEYNSADARPFRQAFDLPLNGAPDGAERWYSFDWGDVHFVALDTERMGKVQAAWLEADLSANTLPWTIVYGHKPPYSSGGHGNNIAFQAYFGPILEKHQVPLVLSGHDHDYERMKPIRGVTYVVTGGGGAGTREIGWSPVTAFGDAVINIVYVTIEGNKLTLHAIDGTGEEFDSLAITR